jgi:hypothetical protein
VTLKRSKMQRATSHPPLRHSKLIIGKTQFYLLCVAKNFVKDIEINAVVSILISFFSMSSLARSTNDPNKTLVT